MSHTSTYDVAIVGYGPVGGATAANLLGGQMGLRVVVIERDPPDIYFRARAISIDEEVLRIWQQVGLADRLNADMQPGAGADFVDTNGVSIAKLLPADRGNGHPPPQQFIYQPAVEGGVLRRGVSRFPNVSLLLQHECLRLTQRSDSVELMLADLTHDEFKRIRASYVIAADGGSSVIRGGQLGGIGFTGRTYSERWIVIDTKVIDEWPGHDRLRFHCNPPERPMVDCPTPPLGHHRWEFPVRAEENEDDLLSEDAIWNVLSRQGITRANVQIIGYACYSHHVRFADRWRVGRVFLAGDAAHAMLRGSARVCAQVCVTSPTCAGNCTPSSRAVLPNRFSTPTRTSAFPPMSKRSPTAPSKWDESSSSGIEFVPLSAIVSSVPPATFRAS